MSQQILSKPPLQVIQEFYRLLLLRNEDWNKPLVPVLRGSSALKLWFAEKARPAADLDIECFDPVSPYPERSFVEYPVEDDLHLELVDCCKMMCRMAAEENTSQSIFEFFPLTEPADGASLWVYGTPGERYYTGWRFPRSAKVKAAGVFESLLSFKVAWGFQRRAKLEVVEEGHGCGQLQIDIAEPRIYRFSEIGIEQIRVPGDVSSSLWGWVYNQEMMLASKLSWLLRSFDWDVGATWHGEPKDLFDARLLICEGKIDPSEFQRTLRAVGMEDDLRWSDLIRLIDLSRELTDSEFHNWHEFAEAHGDLASIGPAESLRMIADRLPGLLGDFLLPQEQPFLEAIEKNFKNETGFDQYIDWLENCCDRRADVMRFFADVYFARNPDYRKLDRAGEIELIRRLKRALDETSQTWVHRLFGRGSTYVAMQGRLESSNLIGVGAPWRMVGGNHRPKDR